LLNRGNENDIDCRYCGGRNQKCLKLSKQIELDINIYDTIRKNIKKYRLERNMTSSELAEMVGLSHEFIRQIQSEKIAYNFSVDTLYKISVVLGVTIDDLIKNREYEEIAS